MKISDPNAKNLTNQELQELEKLKVLIKRYTSYGKISRYAIEMIKFQIQADGKVTSEEIAITRTLIWEQVQQGKLELEWEEWN